MNTIHAKWLEFQDKVVPKNASPVQIKEMRKSFYAGIWAYMQLQLANGHLDEEAYMALMEVWEVEVAEFALQMQKQEAKANG
jgi:CRISPR/Cas system-associated exonuclease Cas4 (RecB family)